MPENKIKITKGYKIRIFLVNMENKIESFNLSREIILSKLDKIENWAKLRNGQKMKISNSVHKIRNLGN